MNTQVQNPETASQNTAQTSEAEQILQSRIMIIDDQPLNIKVLQKYLSLEGYSDFVDCCEPIHALEMIRSERPDIILLDIMMPQVSGTVILEQVRSDPKLAHIPVIILTASSDVETRQESLQLGATDFLMKPVDPLELIPRMRNSLALKHSRDQLVTINDELEARIKQRTAELNTSRLEVIHCLGRASEYRDNETGRHVIRVGRYVGIIARELGLDEKTAEIFELAAPLHDVGKIGIPDAILLKPDKLTPDEFEVMQRHCNYGKRTFEEMENDDWNTFRLHTTVGNDIFKGTQSPFLRVASNIALTHHEWWDGTGYPLGLAGEDIPLEGRITAVADVFDALSSKRPYKSAFPLAKCFDIMESERGTHFDPTVLDAFIRCRDQIIETQIRFADTE